MQGISMMLKNHKVGVSQRMAFHLFVTGGSWQVKFALGDYSRSVTENRLMEDLVVKIKEKIYI